MRTGLATLLCALAGVLAAPGVAAAAGNDPRHEAALQALRHAQDLRQGVGVKTGRELTPALAELAQKRKHLGSDGRLQADALFARPTGSESAPGHPYSVAEATPDCGTHFCIHYVTTTTDAPDQTDTSPANGIPDYVDDMLSAFENQVFPCENGTGVNACDGGTTSGRGWPQAPSDGSLGGDSKFDVYIEDLFPARVFGYVSPDSDNNFNTDSWHSYLVLDKDFSRFSATISGPNEMRVTAAHEYNHVLQFGVDAWEDTWMFESTATYFENVVYPNVDDYLSYLGTWVNSTADALTDPDGGGSSSPQEAGLKIYGSAVWNHWLAHQYGSDTILAAWQAKDRPAPLDASFAPGSYSDAIQAGGGTTFESEFARFAASTAEWRVPGSGYPDLYPPVERLDALTIGAAGKTEFLDHTTFMLLSVPTTTAPELNLTATLPAGLSGSIALVGRTGGADTAGTTTPEIVDLPSGGTGTVTLGAANTFGRITAILVNSDLTQTGYDFNKFEWNFSQDHKQFSGVRAYVGPTVTTGAASSISTTGATLNGTVNPQNKSTSWHFEYGTDITYGTSTPGASGLTGTTGQAVSDAITGLQPGTTYHYRLVGTNSSGTATGGDQTFTTLGPPVVSTGAATTISQTGATLNGTVNPGGQATDWHFELGTTTAYGQNSPNAGAGSGQTASAVSAAVSGLAPNTTYHYRVVASNASGTVAGQDQTFTTATPPATSTGAGTTTGTTGTTTGTTGATGTTGTTTPTFLFTASVVKDRLLTVLKKGLKARASCRRSCTVSAKLVISKKLATKLRLRKTTVATGRATLGASGGTLRLRFTKAARAALAKLRSLPGTVTFSTRDPSGRSVSLKRAIRLRR